MFMNQPDTINIENSEIGVPLILSSREPYSQEGIQNIIEIRQPKMKNYCISFFQYILVE